MVIHPLLDLNQITVDPAMARRISYGTALYYMALPLACEEDQASVVMAHPENTTALTRLRDLLEVDVVAVRGARDAIYSALQRVNPQHPQPAPKILAWSAQPETSAVQEMANLFAAAIGSGVDLVATPGGDVNSLLAAARRESYSLAVVRPPAGIPDVLLRHVSSPILLARAGMRPLQRVLVVMRGFSSDEYALEWLLPLLRHTGAAVTLLPMLKSSYGSEMLNGNGMWRAHVRGCLQRLGMGGLHAHLKLREGNPLQQIADEVEEEEYDLLVIPAEGYGEFVGNVLAEVACRPHGAGCPVLVMKPSAR